MHGKMNPSYEKGVIAIAMNTVRAGRLRTASSRPVAPCVIPRRFLRQNQAWPVRSKPQVLHGTNGWTIRAQRPRAFTSNDVQKSAAPAGAAPVVPEQTPSPPPAPAVYEPPNTGLLAVLPSSWVPYAELIRLDKPAGTYYLFFPCLFSTLMAAPLATPMASPGSVIGTSALFFAGALIMRGAGCTINDLWDRNLDPHVTRTRLRPIARGAVTPFQGLVFTGAQLLAGLAILLQFPLECFFYATPSLLLVASYPLAKRVTYYPQFALGLTFSWGAFVGFPALGVDLLSNTPALMTAALLYSSNVAWTVLYDGIYAHMDVKDDAKAGIKSVALAHDQSKRFLVGLGAVQIGLLAASGIAAGAGPAFFVGSCGGAALTLGYMIKKVNLKDVKDCWWWFVNGCWITGGAVSAGMAVDYTLKNISEDGAEETQGKP
ncbi:hypothetical protein INS49_011637 [Diaporthe citri]|uniref:uncharacterized protein n=1 Tax=Diaporthe citri TaxID=83186 RepID=UPI001C8150F4|nr:uncharacterized protein INS49_011637 [Diaporthe citri]KAG6360575.1 hypothetical protein INS49_011637 [Diaporthe citri]